MSSQQNYGPSIKAARLYEKTSVKGATYFVGRMGGVKVALLKSRDVADDGGPIWDLVFSEAPARTGQAAQRRPVDQAARDQAAARDYQRPAAAPAPSGPDDAIPF